MSKNTHKYPAFLSFSVQYSMQCVNTAASYPAASQKYSRDPSLDIASLNSL